MKKVQITLLSLLVTGQVFSQAITDNGTNVGIGNASPIHKLDVNGDINMSTGNALLIGGNQVVSTAGSRNMFLGDGTGTNITTGGDNAVIGFKAGEFLNEGRFNTIIGFKAAQNMTNSLSNTIIGREAGKNSTGNQNVLIGRQAGENSEGGENTAIGDRAGLGITTGSSITLIGKDANVSSGDLINATAIGAGAVAGTSNSVILGNGADVGIGTSAPSYDLDVVGDINFTGNLYDNGVLFSGGAGPTGPTGSTGNPGINGVIGPTGPIGPQGTAGPTGNTSWTVSGNNQYSSVSGNVGVGINDPGSKFHVHDSNFAFASFSTDQTGDSAFFDGFLIGTQNTGDAFIYNYENEAIKLGTNGEENMRIDPSGNVGIGISAPSTKLHVHDPSFAFVSFSTDLTGNSAFNDGMVVGTQNDGKAFVYNYEDEDLSFGTNGVERMTLSSEGNIGINTNTPNAKLTVLGDSVSYDPVVVIKSSYNGFYDGLALLAETTEIEGKGLGLIGRGGSTGVRGIGQGYGSQGNSIGVYGSANGYAGTRTGVYGYAENIQGDVSIGVHGSAYGADTLWSGFFSEGDVHVQENLTIGTQTVDDRLRISSEDDSKVSAKIIAGNAGDTSSLKLFESGDYGFELEYDGANDRLDLWSRKFAGNEASRMSWLKDGNVGIGTATPSAFLEVETDKTKGFKLDQTVSTSANVYGAEFYVNRTGTDGNAYGTYQYVETNGGDNETQTVGGFFLADSDTEGQSYGILSEATGSGTLWSGWFWGDVYSHGSYLPSDRNLKTNINDLDNAGEIVSRLKVHTYNYRTDQYPSMHLQEGERFGFVAQELEEVLPQLVKTTGVPNSTGPDDVEEPRLPGISVVNYTELIPILTAAIQEQQQQIELLQPESSISTEEFDALKAQNDALNEEVSDLKAELDQIKEMFARFDSDLQQCCFNYDENAGSNIVIQSSSEESGSDSPILEQNAPNPFRENSVIKYYLPATTQSAALVITDQSSTQLKSFNLQGKGFGQVLISGGSFSSGTYIYTLVINGERVASKQMVML